MFDIEKFMTTSPIEVCTANIRFHDMRTGEAFCRAIFRPGRSVSFATLSKELAMYGYFLDWMDDAPGNVPGKLDWSSVFGKFMQEEEA